MPILNTKISLTTVIPIDTVRKNGFEISKEAAMSALSKMHTGIPIMYWGDCDKEKLIGATTSTPYAVQEVDNSHGIQYTVDGIIFFGDFEFAGLGDNMEITSIGLSNN